jgi:hypothetical protein
MKNFQKLYGEGFIPLIVLFFAAFLTVLVGSIAGEIVAWVWRLMGKDDHNMMENTVFIVALVLGPYFVGYLTQIVGATAQAEMIKKVYNAGFDHGQKQAGNPLVPFPEVHPELKDLFGK